ncbi:hypothetical protein N9R04_02925 [Staphylococcus sp. SQ8-PEA]|uniref:Mid2-like cell wall stress sensor domain protein n=1 Tax=Staphylococcus marylandisciuri TaxID=2981529 RepID=A0ABT2QNY1_9STAP|nr:hypothetical protein [Staphylococcus marylandisciuri]MCU5745674.1 hypothetical protein [Staphylococcus marylandisciuri]
MEENKKDWKVWAWVFIVLTIISPFFAIGSIICSIEYKKYDEAKRSKLLMIAIIVGVIMVILNFLAYFG